MQQIDDIAAEVRRGARIGDAEAARLWREAPLWLLGELATERKRRMSGDKVYFNNRGKGIMLAVIGSEDLSHGANIGHSHHETPLLD